MPNQNKKQNTIFIIIGLLLVIVFSLYASVFENKFLQLNFGYIIIPIAIGWTAFMYGASSSLKNTVGRIALIIVSSAVCTFATYYLIFVILAIRYQTIGA